MVSDIHSCMKIFDNLREGLRVLRMTADTLSRNTRPFDVVGR